MDDRDQVAPQRATILVVDDDPGVRHALKFSLELEGFFVRGYRNGGELLRDSDLPAHGCLVIDFRLPDQTGLDLLAKLRHRQVTLPAIIITTSPSAAVRQRAALAGAPIIEKPLLSEALFLGIRAALDGAAKTGRTDGHHGSD